ncbi:Uncharacterised protein [Mycobacteroides abscessus]|nr:Uncharacterised protein [Mycobacteroides abscessus]
MDAQPRVVERVRHARDEVERVARRRRQVQLERRARGLVLDDRPALPAREAVQRGPAVRLRDRDLVRRAVDRVLPVAQPVGPGEQDGAVERGRHLVLAEGREDRPAPHRVLADGRSDLGDRRCVVAVGDADLGS